MEKKVVMSAMVLISTISLFANWGGSSFGNVGSGHFRPFGVSQVQIIDEKLDIQLYKTHAQVMVTYKIKNEGDDVEIKAGFPSINFSTYDEIEDYEIKCSSEKLLFKKWKGKRFKGVTIDESYTPFKAKNIRYYRDVNGFNPNITWYISKLKIKKNEIKDIVITYNSYYHYEEGGFEERSKMSAGTFRYLLSTGSVWKGPIKKGIVTITPVSISFDSIKLSKNNLKHFVKKNNQYVWEFNNLELSVKDNLKILIGNERWIFPYIESKYTSYIYEKPYYYLLTQEYKINASSYLKNKNNYSAANVKDVSYSTAWVEGKKDSGIGEYLLLTLDKPSKIDELGIIPGYAKSKYLYFANNRLKKIDIIINDDKIITHTFVDEYTNVLNDYYAPLIYDYIPLKYNLKIKSIKIIIREVYNGSKYNDTCVSGIILKKRLLKKPREINPNS